MSATSSWVSKGSATAGAEAGVGGAAVGVLASRETDNWQMRNLGTNKRAGRAKTKTIAYSKVAT